MAVYHCGMNDTLRDTVDCLLSELKDADEALGEALAWPSYGDSVVENVQGYAADARASIERAYQLVSDLKAAQS